MAQRIKSGIMAGGRERLIAAVHPDIEREIRGRHAAELERAGLFERLQIEARIRAEIRAALAQAAPPDALY